MAIHLNHTIVSARDRDSSAQFLSEILNLPAPETVGPFAKDNHCMVRRKV